MNTLQQQISIQIFSYCELNDLLIFESISSDVKKLIRSQPWPHLIVKVKNDIKLIEYVINNYSFVNYDLSGCNKITDESISKLINCHTLDLSWCKQITDASVSKLGNCHTLDLNYCDQITVSMKEKLGKTVKKLLG